LFVLITLKIAREFTGKKLEKLMQIPSRRLTLKHMSVAYKVNLPYRSRYSSVKFLFTRKMHLRRVLHHFFFHFFLVSIIARFPCTLSQAGLVWQPGGEGWKLRGTKLQPQVIIKNLCDP
jgi:hypothetical protein